MEEKTQLSLSKIKEELDFSSCDANKVKIIFEKLNQAEDALQKLESEVAADNFRDAFEMIIQAVDDGVGVYVRNTAREYMDEYYSLKHQGGVYWGSAIETLGESWKDKSDFIDEETRMQILSGIPYYREFIETVRALVRKIVISEKEKVNAEITRLQNTTNALSDLVSDDL